ncbi:MAG: ABC transporter ATP-binding protein/permease [Alphaproteobacteria bacterium]|nr:ABC transporter ATP-binding protein/permease [Alphaproteobacteria bacterium]
MKLTKEIREKILHNMFVVNYKRMWPYMKPFWVRALLSVLIAIPVGSLDAVIALSLKPYMDVVMVDKNLQTAWYIPLMIIGFTVIQGILRYGSEYLNTWVGAKTTNLLKLDLYKKMLAFETEFFNKKNSGDVIFMFNNNADMACSGLLNNLKSFVQKFFTALSLICVLFYNSWQLALVCVAIMLFAMLPMTMVRKKINSIMNQSIVADSALITAYNETYNGNKTIISYNLDKNQRNKFETVLDGVFRLRMKMLQRTRWLTPVMHIILSVGIGLAIWFGSYLILHGTITAGSFVSFLTALIMLYTPIKSIGGTYNSVLMSFLAIERVFDILDTVPAITDKSGARDMKSDVHEIEYKNVNFEYVKGVPVLQNINFRVKRGETIAFVGNSGGGKSTVVSLLPRFYDVTSGSILIDGVDVRDITLKSLRANIGVVFQDNFLFSGTIRENIMMGNETATQEDLDRAVEMACLDDFIKTIPGGLDAQIGERGVLLSGGQKQRVAIARAFLKNAPILVVDEARSALDNKSEAVVQRAIENLMRDKTVFVIAHRLSTIKNANKIMVINHGVVVESGTHEELLKNENGAYKALYDMQFKTEKPIKKVD